MNMRPRAVSWIDVSTVLRAFEIDIGKRQRLILSLSPEIVSQDRSSNGRVKLIENLQRMRFWPDRNERSLQHWLSDAMLNFR
jgi:hypothetical protein